MSRSNWKGPYVNSEHLKNVELLKKKHTVLEMSRNSEIIPEFLGLTFKIHNGKSYTEVDVTEEMVGHKFGEFSPTRAKFTLHGPKNKPEYFSTRKK
jgi:small subunit ribosomal protein S19